MLKVAAIRGVVNTPVLLVQLKLVLTMTQTVPNTTKFCSVSMNHARANLRSPT
ncbi:MAG: hypothetical protein IT173_02565 [Acidobacteria bacterium]|nr:hypothetical protein [Acidobacteriota bacterium]